MNRALLSSFAFGLFALVAWYIFGGSAVVRGPAPNIDVSAPKNAGVSSNRDGLPDSVERAPTASATKFPAAADGAGFIPWTKLTLSDPLEGVMARAAKARNLDEAYSGGQVSIVCGTSQKLKDSNFDGTAQYLFPSATAEQRATAKGNMKAAYAKLAKYCASFSEPPQVAALSQIQSTIVGGNSVTKSLVRLPPRSVVDDALPTLTQEQTQAAIVALSQPTVYPMALDRALSGTVIGLPSYWALPDEQRELAQSVIYWELTGDRSPDSVRNVFTCYIKSVCLDSDGQVSYPVPISAEVSTVAREVMELIRRQDWTALGVQR
jgi:hypothetical protein